MQKVVRPGFEPETSCDPLRHRRCETDVITNYTIEPCTLTLNNTNDRMQPGARTLAHLDRNSCIEMDALPGEGPLGQ